MPKRRANGEGNIRKRKDGRWEGRYAVIAAARSIYEGTEQVTAADLAIPEVVPLSAFRLIIHALLVARYGLDVLKITKKAA